MKKMKKKVAIIGCGNIGGSIADGLFKSQIIDPKNVYLTKRNTDRLEYLQKEGFNVTDDNRLAVKQSDILIIALTPQQLDQVLSDIKDVINPQKHTLLSVVSGVDISRLKSLTYDELPVVRVMPNTAIAIRESMTCISADDRDITALETAKVIFDQLGKTVVIHEDLMVPATSLVACGVAFFLRAIRAASQGGIEIGFHADEAIFMAAQTAKGAAGLLLEKQTHPEKEVDKVTTPRGLTISGLNQMEHHGFSSAMIKGIVTSAERAKTLYSETK
ncbi:MAG: pyrroline-5-carboxylate reductase [Melioribacteraceae bacterium]|nr:pyrroline-5-carboxylate reductase [Melioribacteraceae bacterium]